MIFYEEKQSGVAVARCGEDKWAWVVKMPC